jgi:hypothetical protein
MRKYLSWAVFYVLGVGFLFMQTSRAETLLIGQISFDASGTDNTFDLYNLTDGLSNPDGIADNVLFSGSLAVDVLGVGTQVYTFSDIDSLLTGVTSPTIIGLPTGDNILSATLTLTLSSSTGVNIFDDGGNPAVANLLAVPNISVPILSGSFLTPCDPQGDPCSQTNIYVDTAPAGSVIPEPGTLWLVTSGIVGVVASGRRWRKA